MADSTQSLRKTIERFVRQQVFRTRDNPLDRFELRTASVMGKGTEVDTLSLPPDINNESIWAIVDQIISTAQSYADGLGSKLQRFVVIALESGARTGAQTAFKLRGEGGDDEEGEDGAELAPTQAGQLLQQMRHSEALMRMFVMGNQTVIAGLTKQLENSNRLVENLSSQRQKDLETIEASRSMQHERELQLLTAGGQEDRKAEAFKKLGTLFPLLVNKLAGQSVLPAGDEGNVLKKFVGSLDDNQLAALLQQVAPLLNQEQQILLLSLIKGARGEQSSNGAS